MRSLAVAAILAAAAGLTSAPHSAVPPPATAESITLTQAGAQRVLDSGLAYIAAQGTTGAVAVVDDGGHLLALIRTDNTFPSASDVAGGKARTAAIFRRPTRQFEDSINGGRTALAAVASTTDFTPLQGGVPIVIRGRVIGAVGVSGAASAAQDEEIALAAAAALADGATPAAAASSK